MLTKKQYKALSKKKLIKMNKNQRRMIELYKENLSVLHDQLEADCVEINELRNMLDDIHAVIENQAN